MTSERVIEDYATMAGQARASAMGAHGNQSGDPRRLADAVIGLVAEPEPAPQLVLGSAALAAASASSTRPARTSTPDAR